MSTPKHIPSVATNSSATTSSARINRRQTSPFVHVAVLTSIVVLPYLVVRRQLVSMRRTVAQMGAANAVMRRDLKSLMTESAVRKLEHQKVLGLLRETKESMDVLKRLAERRDTARRAVEERLAHEVQDTRLKLDTLEADVLERDLARQHAEKKYHSELKALLHESQWSKAHLSTLKDLGTSLADIAAFMHEVEIKEGYSSSKDDAHGIERIRRLALRFMRSEKSSGASKRSKADAASGPDSDKQDP
ncbi:hypothetical protein SCP_0207600 [Sparassis crispa]|uniref:Uncharacterized protein n=1 Tax=Sparassis crispa TaxID=139825 RepID=A0A401GBL0_9APHY|nr:hypothetical protein SCP_0207600 [Sparassis crispa]GBE79560.1 hypothetical protein SCP_0207600 [Sparassis crispa]